MFSLCGNKNLRDFDQFWSIFSDLKHVLCTDAIIRLLTEDRGCPRPLHSAQLCSSPWLLSRPPFDMYTLWVYIWCWRVFYANLRWLYQKIKSCLASAQRKLFFWGRWLSSFASRHFSNSHCSAPSLPGMLVGWENMRLEKWRKRQFEWIQIFSEDLGEEGVRCMWKEEMRGRRVRTPLGWERVLGEEMCF